MIDDKDSKKEFISDKWSMLQRLTESRVLKEQGTDIILSKIDRDEKEYITERIEIAYKIRNALVSLVEISEEEKIISKEEKQKIETIQKRMIDEFMRKVNTIITTNRNDENNTLIKWIIGVKDEEEKEEETEPEEGMAKKIMKKIGKAIKKGDEEE